MSGSKTQSGGDYCLTSLRDLDRDRYLACLLMPEAIRSDMAALYLFNAEIARIRDLVHDPLPGEIRLQWWRDLFEKGSNGENAGPLAKALFDVVARHNLPRQAFVNMLDARIFDLYDDPMGSANEFEGYAGETASALIQSGLLISAPDEAADLADASGHAGVAQAVAGALLLMPRHMTRGQVYLPVAMLGAVGLDRESFLNAQDKPKLDSAVELFASFGLDHLEKARAGMKGSKNAFYPFLPVALAGPILKKALKMKSSLLHQLPGTSQLRRQWQLLRASVTQKI